MLGLPVLSRGAAVLGAVPVGWGMGSCRRHISQRHKNSSSNAQWGFSCGIFTRNQGFHQWHCGESFSPLPKFRAQDCAGASPTSSLAASHGSPLSTPRFPPDWRCSPQFNPPQSPSIPWHICRALTKPVVQGRAGGLWPPVSCQPWPSPGATFTKYGRFFLPPVFGTQATAQEHSFPDAEVSPALLPSPCSFPAASQWAWPCTHRDRSNSTPSTCWNLWIPHQHPVRLAQA